MTDGPTTFNGPLHTTEATTGDRAITASFADAAAAQAVQQSLVSAGIAEGSISRSDNAAHDPAIRATRQPADKGILGTIREAILPEDSDQAVRDAVQNDYAILVVRPTREQVDTVIGLIQAGHPIQFDAELERWRNLG